MLDYYKRLVNEYAQAHAAIYSASKRATEASRDLERAKKQVDDAIALAERIVSKMRRIEKSEYAQRDIEIALYGVCVS